MLAPVAGLPCSWPGLGDLIGLLAFFADDLEGQPVHGSGIAHLALAFVAFVCVAIWAGHHVPGESRLPAWMAPGRSYVIGGESRG